MTAPAGPPGPTTPPFGSADGAPVRSSAVDHSADAAIAALSDIPPVGVATDRPAPGFAPGRTLGLRVELARQIRRRRTQLSAGFMVLLPALLAIAFAAGASPRGPNPSGRSYVDLATTGTANFVTVTLFFSASFLLIVIVALFFGDTVASEASWSSLRYLLALPVPRRRLLRQKIVVAGLLALGCIAVLVIAAALIGLVAYGAGPLQSPLGDSYRGWAASGRLAIIAGYVAVQLIWVAGLGFLLTVSTDVPLGAVGGTVVLGIVSQILDQITALGSLRNVLPTHESFGWTGALVSPVDWGAMAQGALVSLSYGLVFVVAGFLRFGGKDITS